MKWLLSPQTKHLLSFRARRPPRMMRIVLGDAPSLMLLRCSAPDQAFLVRRLERCASRPMPLPRRPSPVAAGAVPCTTWDMVPCSTHPHTSMLSVGVFFGAWGANRLALKLALLNTFFSTAKNAISHTFNGRGKKRIDYILTRQRDRKFVRDVTVHPQPSFLPISDHNIVTAHVKLLGRFARNRPVTEARGPPSIDRRRLMTDPHLRQ